MTVSVPEPAKRTISAQGTISLTFRARAECWAVS